MKVREIMHSQVQSIAPEARIGLFQYTGIVRYLEEMFPVRVDVANREGLKPLVRPNAEREAIYAF